MSTPTVEQIAQGALRESYRLARIGEKRGALRAGAFALGLLGSAPTDTPRFLAETDLSAAQAQGKKVRQLLEGRG